MSDMQTFYFTFGSGQQHFPGYHRIEATNEDSAYKIMNHRFGPKWAMSYTSAEAAGIARWNLPEIRWDGVPHALKAGRIPLVLTTTDDKLSITLDLMPGFVAADLMILTHLHRSNYTDQGILLELLDTAIKDGLPELDDRDFEDITRYCDILTRNGHPTEYTLAVDYNSAEAWVRQHHPEVLDAK